MPEEIKLRLEHHLQIERLILDKLLIGLLLIVAGYGVNSLIESLKATAVQSQYLLDKRLVAATEIREALTEVVTPIYAITLSACTGAREKDGLPATARQALEKLAAALNSNALLVKQQYLSDAERAVSVFYGLVAHDCYASCDVRIFIDHVSQYVTDETREQVMPGGGAAVIAPRGTSFRPLPWTDQELLANGNKVFLERNFDAWRSKQAAPSSLNQICRTRNQ